MIFRFSFFSSLLYFQRTNINYCLFTSSDALHTAIIDSNGVPDVTASRLATEVLTRFVGPLASLNIDDTEFSCLKTIAFFNPGEYTISIPENNVVAVHSSSKISGNDTLSSISKAR